MKLSRQFEYRTIFSSLLVLDSFATSIQYQYHFLTLSVSFTDISASIMAKDNVRLANVINNSAADAPDPEKAAKLRALSRRALTTQKKGHAYDKEMEVIHQSWTALARPKVPRGVARLFASRTHHWYEASCFSLPDTDYLLEVEPATRHTTSTVNARVIWNNAPTTKTPVPCPAKSA